MVDFSAAIRADQGTVTLRAESLHVDVTNVERMVPSKGRKDGKTAVECVLDGDGTASDLR